MSGFPNRTCVQVVNLQDVYGVEQLLYVELRRKGVDVKAVVRLVDESYKEFGVRCSAYVYLWDAAGEPHARLANNLYGQRFSIFDDAIIFKATLAQMMMSATTAEREESPWFRSRTLACQTTTQNSR